LFFTAEKINPHIFFITLQIIPIFVKMNLQSVRKIMENDLLKEENIASKIFVLRGKRVMLDSDLAEIYNVETKMLNRAVKRNQKRFPKDFMLQLSNEEWDNLRFQNGTSSWGGRRTLPFAFTEHGIIPK
jgi:hypothetical protein